MKNYRDFIHVSIFYENIFIVGLDGDTLKFGIDGHVFLYRDNVIVAHFPNGVWDKANLISKHTVKCTSGTIFQMNYWVEL